MESGKTVIQLKNILLQTQNKVCKEFVVFCRLIRSMPHHGVYCAFISLKGLTTTGVPTMGSSESIDTNRESIRYARMLWGDITIACGEMMSKTQYLVYIESYNQNERVDL